MIYALETDSKGANPVVKSDRQRTLTDAIQGLALMKFADFPNLLERTNFRRQLTIDRVMAPPG